MTQLVGYATLFPMDRDDATTTPPPVVPASPGVVRSITSLKEQGMTAEQIAVALSLTTFVVNAVLNSPLSKALRTP